MAEKTELPPTIPELTGMSVPFSFSTSAIDGNVGDVSFINREPVMTKFELSANCSQFSVSIKPEYIPAAEPWSITKFYNWLFSTNRKIMLLTESKQCSQASSSGRNAYVSGKHVDDASSSYPFVALMADDKKPYGLSSLMQKEESLILIRSSSRYLANGVFRPADIVPALNSDIGYTAHAFNISMSPKHFIDYDYIIDFYEHNLPPVNNYRLPARFDSSANYKCVWPNTIYFDRDDEHIETVGHPLLNVIEKYTKPSSIDKGIDAPADEKKNNLSGLPISHIDKVAPTNVPSANPNERWADMVEAEEAEKLISQSKADSIKCDKPAFDAFLLYHGIYQSIINSIASDLDSSISADASSVTRTFDDISNQMGGAARAVSRASELIKELKDDAKSQSELFRNIVLCAATHTKLIIPQNEKSMTLSITKFISYLIAVHFCPFVFTRADLEFALEYIAINAAALINSTIRRTELSTKRGGKRSDDYSIFGSLTDAGKVGGIYIPLSDPNVQTTAVPRTQLNPITLARIHDYDSACLMVQVEDGKSFIYRQDVLDQLSASNELVSDVASIAAVVNDRPDADENDEGEVSYKRISGLNSYKYFHGVRVTNIYHNYDESSKSLTIETDEDPECRPARNSAALIAPETMHNLRIYLTEWSRFFRPLNVIGGNNGAPAMMFNILSLTLNRMSSSGIHLIVRQLNAAIWTLSRSPFAFRPPLDVNNVVSDYIVSVDTFSNVDDLTESTKDQLKKSRDIISSVRKVNNQTPTWRSDNSSLFNSGRVNNEDEAFKYTIFPAYKAYHSGLYAFFCGTEIISRYNLENVITRSNSIIISFIEAADALAYSVLMTKDTYTYKSALESIINYSGDNGKKVIKAMQEHNERANSIPFIPLAVSKFIAVSSLMLNNLHRFNIYRDSIWSNCYATYRKSIKDSDYIKKPGKPTINGAYLYNHTLDVVGDVSMTVDDIYRMRHDSSKWEELQKVVKLNAFGVFTYADDGLSRLALMEGISSYQAPVLKLPSFERTIDNIEPPETEMHKKLIVNSWPIAPAKYTAENSIYDLDRLYASVDGHVHYTVEFVDDQFVVGLPRIELIEEPVEWTMAGLIPY